MISKKFRALATALLLGSASVAGLCVCASSPVAAATVRPAVGSALNAAIRDANSGNGSAAMEKIHEAESAPNLTSSEQSAISQTKQFVAAKTGGRAKFAADYAAGRYSAVVGPDAEELRKSGEMSEDDEVYIAQAYYLMHNYDGCIRVVHGMGHAPQKALELLKTCAFETHDEAAVEGALEQLVVDYNQPKYWSDLLASAENSGALSNPDTLDLSRLRLLTGTMRNASDYETGAEIAIQLGFPTEGQAIAQKGLDLKLLSPVRGAKLVDLAKAQAAADVANLAKTAAAANAAKTGDASVKLGEDYWGMGRYQDALAALKAGIAKGVTNPDEAQIRLAMTYIELHQRDAAVQALKAVSKTAPTHTQTITRLWSVFARTH